MSVLDSILPEPLSKNSGLTSMDAADYHADPAVAPSLSSSVLKILLNQSPAHARVAHPRLNPDFEVTNDKKFDLGTVAHELLLEGETAIRVVEADDWRTAAAKEERDLAYADGLTPLLAKDWARVEAMAQAATRQLEMFDLNPMPLASGKPEQVLLWEEDGVWCRARYDWLHDNLSAVDDLKTTAVSANPAAWSKTMLGMGAELQAAFYLRGLRKALGAEAAWRFIVQENYPPYALSVVELSPDLLAHAGAKVDRAIDLWRRCLADNHWPSYSRELGVIELPGWIMSEAQAEVEDYGESAPF